MGAGAVTGDLGLALGAGADVAVQLAKLIKTIAKVVLSEIFISLELCIQCVRSYFGTGIRLLRQHTPIAQIIKRYTFPC